MCNEQAWGVYWNISGAGWVSSLPLHYEQMSLPGVSTKTFPPLWGGKPLTLTEARAKQLADDFCKIGWGDYVARPMHSLASAA